MVDSTLRGILWRQFGAAIDMLGNAMAACPDELWEAPVPELGFWYVAYHALFWLDLYLTGSVEGFAPPAPFTLDELDPAGLLPDRTYTKDELLAYLNRGRRKCRTTIETLTEEGANQRCRFGWGEVSFLELLLYNLRHVQEHAAQLSLLLGQQAGWDSDWVPSARA